MNKLTKIAITLATMTALAGLAAAGDSKSPAAGAPAMKAGETPKMDMTPPKELADMAKQMTGTWKCKGQSLDDSMKMVDMNATMTTKLENNGWWLHDSFDAKMGANPFHFDSYATYDAKAKKYHRVMTETGGGWSTGDSMGMQGGKIDWDLSSHSMMGDYMFRDHVDASDPKAGVKPWGEMSMDGGKTWQKVYEMTCKK